MRVGDRRRRHARPGREARADRHRRSPRWPWSSSSGRSRTAWLEAAAQDRRDGRHLHRPERLHRLRVGLADRGRGRPLGRRRRPRGDPVHRRRQDRSGHRRLGHRRGRGRDARRRARRAAARNVLADGEELRAAAAFGGTVTKFAAIDAARVGDLAADPAVVSVEPWVEPKLLDERAASIVAGRVNAAGTTLTGPGYLGIPRTATGSRPHWRPTRSTSPTRASTRASCPSRPARTPTSSSTATPRRRAGSSTPRRRRPATPTRATAAVTAPTSPRSPPATTPRPGATFEDAQGFNYGLGIAPRARLGATKIFNCAGIVRRHDVVHGPALEPPTRPARAISNNSWGANVGGAYNADSREFDFLVRDAQPGVAGNQQMVNVVLGRQLGRPARTRSAPRGRPRT